MESIPAWKGELLWPVWPEVVDRGAGDVNEAGGK